MVERIRIDANLFIEVIVETSHLRRRGLLDELVIPLGLEPKTVCLEGRCSIQLSYGTRGCTRS